MRDIIVGILLSLFLISCSVTNSIILPNGEKGLVVDCTNTLWSVCFKSAGEMCPKGYDIYERSKDEFTESKLPITELPKRVESNEASMIIGESHYPPIIRKDKYMVIACVV